MRLSVCILDHLEPNRAALALLPYSFLRRNLVLPLTLQDGVLFCAVSEHSDIVSLVLQLTVLSGYEIQPVWASPELIEAELQRLDQAQ
jgi:hypothetical protein